MQIKQVLNSFSIILEIQIFHSLYWIFKENFGTQLIEIVKSNSKSAPQTERLSENLDFSKFHGLPQLFILKTRRNQKKLCMKYTKKITRVWFSIYNNFQTKKNFFRGKYNIRTYTEYLLNYFVYFYDFIINKKEYKIIIKH